MSNARETEAAHAPLLFPHAYGEAADPAAPSGPRAVADRLVADHHYLCRRGARKFWRCGLERCDLEQVAAVGLIKASRRYAPASTTPFEAYAWILIVGELMHYVRDHERPVRVPRRLQMLERNFTRAQDLLAGTFGREPNDAELACEMRVAPRTVAELRRARNAALPLELDDIAGYANSDSLSAEDRLIVDDSFAGLDQLGRRIIVGLYLLGFTQLELGRHLGLSAKRVSRLHHAALANMQRAWAS